MLIRHARLVLSPTQTMLTDLRIMHGCVQEIGQALVKGLYEAEIDLNGDLLTAGQQISEPLPAEDEAALRLLCRRLYRQGVSHFCTSAPQNVLENVQKAPERRGARPVRTLPEAPKIGVGTSAPLNRWQPDGRWLGMIDEHSGD